MGIDLLHTVSFRINDVSKVNEVMDVLTSINDVEVDSPIFSINNDNDLKTQAMKLGFEMAKKNFAGQCLMAGVDSSTFHLNSWEIHDGKPNREFTKISMPEVFSPQFEVDALETPETIKAGVASVAVSVTLRYQND